MNCDSSTLPNDEWTTPLGAGFVLALLSLLVLTSLGGWTWVAKFLESSAPAWIQAIGSVAAILAAIFIVRRQHSLEIERIRSVETFAQQRRARALRVVFFSAARACEDAARCIGKEHQVWHLMSDDLLEARDRLLSIDPMLIPSGGLLLLVEECAIHLRRSATLVRELETGRPEQVQETIRMAVMTAARECWLGMYEATGLEARLSKGQNDDSKAYAFDTFEDSRKELDEIRTKFVQSKESI